jgi:hypothetical protein
VNDAGFFAVRTADAFDLFFMGISRLKVMARAR